VITEFISFAQQRYIKFDTEKKFSKNIQNLGSKEILKNELFEFINFNF
jgi:hypothetical protein